MTKKLLLFQMLRVMLQTGLVSTVLPYDFYDYFKLLSNENLVWKKMGRLEDKNLEDMFSNGATVSMTSIFLNQISIINMPVH